MRDLSIDLETLGTTPGSAILAIGAVVFDRETGELGAEFYRSILLHGAMEAGTVSADTLLWWLRQSDAARQDAFHDPNAVSLYDALFDFHAFCKAEGPLSPWGNGATFDVSIIEAALAKTGNAIPWSFWNIRDMRTLVDVAEFDRTSIPFEGVAHNALDDAKHQARCVSAAWRKVRK